MSKRKVISVQPLGAEFSASYVALCDDGTIWECMVDDAGNARWNPIPLPPGCERGRKP